MKKRIYSPNLIQSFLSLEARPVHNSFGGSGPLGGLNKKAFVTLNKFCRIYGMGAAEFEGRYLPDALKDLQSYVAKGSLSIKTIKVGRDLEVKKDLIVLAHEDCIDECCEVLTKWAHEYTWDEVIKKKLGKKYYPVRTKCNDQFRLAIDSTEFDPQLPVGWISEDNEPYMFFLSEKMASDFIKLLYTDIYFHKR